MTYNQKSDRDIQAQFETRADRNDFLTAGKVEEVVGLCLSGGGYRAMVYHTGALVRLNEFGILSRIREIASVSGGSIVAAALGLAWRKMRFNSDGYAANIVETFVIPVMQLAGIGIDVKASILGLLPGFTAADEISKAYDRHLLFNSTLQDLPDTPRITFMATNLQTGSGWRFAKDYAADYRVGRIDRPTLQLSKVVAASSAFPPFLSPLRLDFETGVVQPMQGTDLHRQPYTKMAFLTDGGVYDNLGLERVWRRCRTVLVSNAGKMTPELGRPTGRWIGQLFRTFSIIHQQGENTRKRMLFGMHNTKQRNVAFWSIDTPITHYGLSDVICIPPETTFEVAEMRTRLNHFTPSEIKLLLESGYAGADASLRSRRLATNKPIADVSIFKNLCADVFGSSS